MVTGQTKAVLTIPERGLEKGQRLPAAACGGIEHESSAAVGAAAAAVMDLPIVILSDDGNSMTAGMKAASNDMKGAGKSLAILNEFRMAKRICDGTDITQLSDQLLYSAPKWLLNALSPRPRRKGPWIITCNRSFPWECVAMRRKGIERTGRAFFPLERPLRDLLCFHARLGMPSRIGYYNFMSGQLLGKYSLVDEALFP